MYMHKWVLCMVSPLILNWVALHCRQQCSGGPRKVSPPALHLNRRFLARLPAMSGPPDLVRLDVGGREFSCRREVLTRLSLTPSNFFSAMFSAGGWLESGSKDAIFIDR